MCSNILHLAVHVVIVIIINNIVIIICMHFLWHRINYETTWNTYKKKHCHITGPLKLKKSWLKVG